MKHTCEYCGGQLTKYSEILVVTEYKLIDKNSGVNGKPIRDYADYINGVSGIICLDCNRESNYNSRVIEELIKSED